MAIRPNMGGTIAIVPYDVLSYNMKKALKLFVKGLSAFTGLDIATA